jgi:hypothetical protein
VLRKDDPRPELWGQLPHQAGLCVEVAVGKSDAQIWDE